MPTALAIRLAVMLVLMLGSFAGGWKVEGWRAGEQIQKLEASNAQTIARINAESATRLAAALSKQQAAEGRVATIQDQFNSEVAAHAKDSLDYRARLLAGTQRVRVHAIGSSCAPSGQGAAPAGGNNDSAPEFYLSPGTAASVISVADSADETAGKLRALQQYVTALQDEGFIQK